MNTSKSEIHCTQGLHELPAVQTDGRTSLDRLRKWFLIVRCTLRWMSEGFFYSLQTSAQFYFNIFTYSLGYNLSIYFTYYLLLNWDEIKSYLKRMISCKTKIFNKEITSILHRFGKVLFYTLLLLLLDRVLEGTIREEKV